MSSIILETGNTEINKADPIPYSCTQNETKVMIMIMTIATLYCIVTPYMCIMSFNSHNTLEIQIGIFYCFHFTNRILEAQQD